MTLPEWLNQPIPLWVLMLSIAGGWLGAWVGSGR